MSIINESPSFLNQEFNKEDLSNFEEELKFENSEIPANSIDIKAAIEKAIYDIDRDFGI